jgi:hypothetical protein
MIGPKGLLIVAAVVAGLGAWGAIERAGRINAGLRLEAAQAELATAEARIRHMEARRNEDDAAAREPDPVGRLREWSRD